MKRSFTYRSQNSWFLNTYTYITKMECTHGDAMRYAWRAWNAPQQIQCPISQISKFRVTHRIVRAKLIYNYVNRNGEESASIVSENKLRFNIEFSISHAKSLMGSCDIGKKRKNMRRNTKKKVWSCHKLHTCFTILLRVGWTANYLRGFCPVCE